MKKLGIFPTLIMLFSSTLCASEGFVYVVKLGDTLSQVAHEQIGSPVYSAHGSLSKILVMNPTIKDSNAIFVGQSLTISHPNSPLGLDLRQSPANSSESSQAFRAIASDQTALVTKESFEKPHEPIASGEPSPSSRIKLQTGLEFFRIDSTDKTSGGKSVLLSNANPTLNFSWQLDWNKAWSSKIGLDAQFFKLLDDQATASRTMNDASGTKLGFEASAVRNWSEFSRSSFVLSFSEKLFSHSSAINSLTVDRVATPSVGLDHEIDVVKISKARLGLGGNFSYLMPGNGPGYRTDVGYAVGVNTYVSHELNNLSLSSRLYYQSESQNSSLAEQVRSSLGITLGIIWRFDE